MFDGQVFILHPFGGFFRLDKRLLHIPGDVYLAGLPAGTGNAGDPVQVVPQPVDQGGNRDSAPGEELGNQLVFILGKGKHQVLLLHLHMLIFDGKRLGTLQGAGGLLRELIHIHKQYLRKGHI